jgi:phosphoglycolate phosphatase-like HAD superfamily hydrolase
MKIETIYIDMDGVIVDFEKGYVQKFGVTPQSTRENKNFANRFEIFIDDGEFSKLDPMPDANLLFTFLNSLSVPKEILSSTAAPHWHNRVATQKQMWLLKHNIQYKANLVPGKDLKHRYATPNSIIIDDTKSVIDDWNKAGGIGILHTDAVSTIGMLKMYL